MDGEVRWSEIDAADLALLISTAGDGFKSQFLDVHQYAPFTAQLGLLSDGGFLGAQLRILAAKACPRPLVRLWAAQASALALPSLRPQLVRGLFKELVPQDQLGDVQICAERVVLAAAAPFNLAALYPSFCEISAPTDEQSCGQELKRSLASQRLDAAVAAFFNLGRSEAKTAIEYGFLFVDWLPCLKVTATIRQGATLLFRQKGRAVIEELALNERSRRTAARARYFPLN